jgi:serine/threonine protein kinase
MVIDVGQVVAKKYKLVRLLGRGSMGDVWSAYHEALREQVAIKMLAWPPSGEDAEEPAVALARFRFEAQVAARLSRRTRHIARVTDYGEDDGLPYLVMELLDGEALDAALRARGPLAPVEASEIVSQIARALGQAHAEGVTHRDLKPANVFLTRDEDGRLLVKLLDFGIARTIHAHRVQGTFSTAKGFVFGTPGYMSPEQTRASPKLDQRCDLWSLATIAYQMVTGHLPVDGADAEEIMKNLCAGRIVPLRRRDPSLPEERIEALSPFFDRAFAEHVDDRFQDAARVAQAFEAACGASSAASAASAPYAAPDSTDSLENTGSTATEFSASVAGEALRMYRRRPTKLVLVSVGAVVAVIAALVGARGAWRSAAGAPSQAGSPAPSPPPSESIVRSVAASVVPPAPSQPAPPVASDGWSARQPPQLAARGPAAPTSAASPHGAVTDRPPTGVVTPRSLNKASTDPPSPPAPASHGGPKAADDRNDVF